MKKIILNLAFLFATIIPIQAKELKFILHDKCINNLYMPASAYFMYDKIDIIRDSRGIILRFKLVNPMDEYYTLSSDTIQKLQKISAFLAKIKNPVIIEVHNEKLLQNNLKFLKNWEISTVIASNIEKVMLNLNKSIEGRINSVGYGEFMPTKNTSNNGGKILSRVDIIILCNISGE